MAAYPDLAAEGLRMGHVGAINLRGGSTGGRDAIPSFSNASDAWLDFMIDVIKTQVDAGMGSIAFDEGWGNLGPGGGSDFSPAAMEGFRRYLEGR